MAVKTRAELKAKFENGDTPTEADFANLIDSLFNLTDDDSDTLTEGIVQLLMTVAERSKLAGIAAGAQVNGYSKILTGLLTATELVIYGSTFDDDFQMFKTGTGEYTITSYGAEYDTNKTSVLFTPAQAMAPLAGVLDNEDLVIQTEDFGGSLFDFPSVQGYVQIIVMP